MKENKDILYCNDILESIDLIEKYIASTNEEEFTEDLEKQDSVIRRLEIIGEAANQLSPEFTNTYSDIPWHAIVALRNKLIHEYSGIDMLKVWDVLINELPKLKEVVEKYLGR